MTRFAKTIAAATLCLPVAVLASDAHQLTAGRWEVQRKILSGTFNGSPLPPEALTSGNDTKFVCISAEEARDPKAYFTKVEAKERCSAPTGEVANGKLKLSGSCGAAEGGQLQLELAGSYGRSEYRMAGTGKMSIQGQPMLFNLTAQGRHVGACKDNEKQ